MDNPILSYYDCLIRLEDFQLLDDNCWLNDIIISFVFEYMTHTTFKDLKDDLILMEPATVQLIKMMPISELNFILDPLEVKQKSWVLLPVNDSESTSTIGGSHWSLLVFSVKSPSKSVHFDSCHGDVNSYDANILAKKLANYLGFDSLSTIENVTCTKQSNGSDCGVFCIVYAQVVSELISQNQVQFNIKSDSHIKTLVSKKRKEVKDIILSLKSSGKIFE